MTVKITKPAINLREILSGIEPNATADQTPADQTPAEIKTAYESNSDTNAFTDSDKTKLDGIEQNATADQTGAEIKAAYEGEADTNAFTDTLLNKLNGIETGADVTDATNVEAAGALMDVELTNEAAVKSINQALTTTSDVAFNQVTAALVGNASTATTLETARDIALSGDVTGSASFDGSGNITIMATVVDDSHSHVISNVDGLQTALDAKQPLDADLTAIAALDSADGNIIVGSASGWVAESGATARASLGLGSIATQAADSVSITGGAISGITDIAVADGGTGASTAADARTNLGLVIGTDVQAYDVDTAKLDVAQSFTAAQRGSTFTATATGSTTYNFSENQNFVLTLSGNLTLANPTTEAVGQSGFFVFIQPSSGGPYTVSLGTEFQTVGGAGLTLSTAANAVDVVPYIVQASGKILLGTPQLAFA